MSDSSSTRDPDNRAEQPRALTDRETGKDTRARQSHLQSVFVNVTGVEECVDEQEGTQVSRYVDADTTSVSAAVTAVATDDGLTDTFDESPGDEMG